MEKLYLRSLASLFIIFSLAISMVLFHAPADSSRSNQEIRWYIPKEAERLSRKLHKPMFVYVYTKWCQDCPKMEKTTFKEKNIIQYINQNYIPVKLNADNHKTIDFVGHHLPVHDLTSDVFGVDIYPSVIWFESKEKTKPVALYIEPNTFKSYLKYYHFKSTESSHHKTLSSSF